MRMLCFLFLLLFAGAVAVFAQQNQQEVSLSFFDWAIHSNVAVVIGAAFVLGMLSGWTIVGMLRRSFNRASELIDNREPARSG